MDFCTYCDHNYLPKAVVLYNSIKNNLDSFRFFVLCLSEEAKTVIENSEFEHMVPILLSELEEWMPETLAAKENRSRIEYYFTLSPILPLYIFNNFENVDWVHYCDSDMAFYHTPKILEPLLGDAVCGITPHDFAPEKRGLERYGIFNVGLVSWKNEPDGIKLLNWYKDRCLEWCYDHLEGDRYADQKYLDKFQTISDRVHVYTHRGINVAPWNIDHRPPRLSGGVWMIEDEPLVLYHFHAVKEYDVNLYSSGMLTYNNILTNEVRDRLMIPYLVEYREAYKRIAPQLDKMERNGIRGQTAFHPELSLQLRLADAGIPFEIEPETGPDRKQCDITALVYTYDSEEQLSQTISDLVHQTCANSLEIIVVQKGAVDADSVVATWKKYFPALYYESYPEETDHYQPWRRAIRWATGRFLVNVVGSCRLFPESLENLRKPLLSGKAGVSYGDTLVSPELHSAWSKFVCCGHVKTCAEESNNRDVANIPTLIMWKKEVPYEIGFLSYSPEFRRMASFWRIVNKQFSLYQISEFVAVEEKQSVHDRSNSYLGFSGDIKQGWASICAISSSINVEDIERITRKTIFPHRFCVADLNVRNGTAATSLMGISTLPPAEQVMKMEGVHSESEYVVLLLGPITITEFGWLERFVQTVEKVESCSMLLWDDRGGDISLREIQELDVKSSLLVIKRKLLHAFVPTSDIITKDHLVSKLVTHVKNTGEKVVVLSGMGLV